MKSLLPPISHSSLSQSVACHLRRVLAASLTSGGLLLAASTLSATMHPPLVTWLADERITTDSLAPQFFRIINLDKDAGVSISVTSQVVLAEPSNFYDANNVEVSPCSAAGGDFAAGCASDGTGYKVEFMANPTSDGVATILIKAKEIGSGGKTGLTSFTIRREQNGDDNPPVIQALPNRVLQVDPGTHTAKYQTHFVSVT